jgi:hypothetical protein
VQHGSRAGQLSRYVAAPRGPRHRRGVAEECTRAGHAGDMDGDFYTVVQVAGAPECPYLEYVDIKGDKDNCPDLDYDDLKKCEDTCLCTGDYLCGTTN